MPETLTAPRCACARHDDGSVTTFLCPAHAEQDPCLTTSQVTGRRRTGTIRRGVCTACGWRVPPPVIDVPETVDRWHQSYQRGLITLDELAEELAKLGRRYGPQPFRRAS